MGPLHSKPAPARVQVDRAHRRVEVEQLHLTAVERREAEPAPGQADAEP
jgi:hypothetical protein